MRREIEIRGSAGRLLAAMRRAQLALIPTAPTGAEKAAAAERAAEALRVAQRELIRAGLAEGAGGALTEPLERVREQIRDEAESLLALADDDEGDVK